MNLRERFITYVTDGGKQICSPQIGGGAGFDTKLAGKEWVSHTTLDDTIAAVERFDILPLINLGLCDLGDCNPLLRWKETLVDDQGYRVYREHILETPVGNLTRKSFEERIKSGFQTKNPIDKPEELDVLEYYIDVAIDSDLNPIQTYVKGLVEAIGGRAALDIQWAMQPYELLCFPNTVDTVMLAYDCPEQFIRLMDKIVILDEKILKEVAAGGADFVFLGGPGAEMISPSYYDNFIVPYSQQVTSIAHSLGLKIYSHICSPIEPFLTMGYYNKMGIDLFETLSPPPVGNISSLKDAMSKLDPAICTRGNLGLDILTNEPPDVIREKTFEIMEATQGRKHMVAASDYLFYQVPEENVHAMASAVKEYNG
ncbi:MAG: uroporphyrinogen decarboxylase family protein [Armatimonadota bacterium]